uniref:Putative glycosyl hydrolase n=1 Tax=uncultured bacterium Ele16D6 TaxID=1340030 RepID=W5RBG0_9BACT|nr:putative glycosyl hydrolase [uncultured bacterium Ele16D6]
MKYYSKLLTTLVLLIVSASSLCGATKEKNNPVPFADPYILSENGKYYMYGSHFGDGIGVLVSDDMKTWRTPVGAGIHHALYKDDSYGESNFWAPEVYHVGDKYYMFYSAELHICVATSDSPIGPFVQKEKKPYAQNGQNIDNTLFIDYDGTPYMFWVHFATEVDGLHIWCAQLEDDLLSIKEGTQRFCTKMSQDWETVWPAVNEGPFVIKNKDTYYLTYSANSYESTCYGIGMATTNDIVNGEWTKYEGNPIFQNPKGLYGVGHHAFFKDARGKNRIAFHSHNREGQVEPRVIHISTWNFDKEGVIRVNEKKIFTAEMEK